MATPFTIVLDVINVWALVFWKIYGLVFVSSIRRWENSCSPVVFVFSGLLLCHSGFKIFIFSGFIYAWFDSVVVYIFLFDLAGFFPFFILFVVFSIGMLNLFTKLWNVVWFGLLCDLFKFFSELGLNTISKNIIILIFTG